MLFGVCLRVFLNDINIWILDSIKQMTLPNAVLFLQLVEGLNSTKKLAGSPLSKREPLPPDSLPTRMSISFGLTLELQCGSPGSQAFRFMLEPLPRLLWVFSWLTATLGNDPPPSFPKTIHYFVYVERRVGGVLWRTQCTDYCDSVHFYVTKFISSVNICRISTVYWHYIRPWR